MFAHSLLSGALILLPIAITVGIYVGIESQKIFNGGFDGSYGVPGSGNSNPDRKVAETNMYCQKLIGIRPAGSRFTYNPNQWGLSANEESGLCLNVTTGLLASKSKYADPFSVTWNFTQGPPTQPVRAFPNALLEGAENLPIPLNKIKEIPVDVAWTYGIGDSNLTSTDEATLVAANVNANVAIDMFMDANSGDSTVTTSANHEVMVWFAKYGPATQPIGWDLGAQNTVSINGTSFGLYVGKNGAGTNVWTWVASTVTNRFVGDILPLVTGLETANGPAGADYLGYFGFGTEAYNSPTNVTFACSSLYIDVL
jgi:hypothetical protein